MPKDKNAYEYFDIDLFMGKNPEPLRYLDAVCQPCFWPPFEVEKIEETKEYAILRDTDGVVKKFNRENESMPQFLEFPIENHVDWEKIKWRLDPQVEGRYENAEKLASSLGNHKEIWRFGVCGAYGFPRSLLGMEKLAYLYYDEPGFIHQIMEQWLYLYTTMADRLCPLIEFDYVFLW